MFGRSAELARVTASLRRADLVGVALTGAVGAGKSCLMFEALRIAESEGFAVVTLYGNRAAAQLPLCALGDFLDASAANDFVGQYVAVRRGLLAHAEGSPLVIAIDDAHLIDDSSAVLVTQLARELSAFLVCTLRIDEAAPEPLAALWVQGVMAVIEVGALEREHVASVAVEAIGGAISPALEAELWRRSAGNALFIRELSAGSAATGAIVLRDGVWEQVRPLAASDALGELVRQRLDRLSDAQRHALSCVALSEPVGVELIEVVADGESLIALEEAGLVQVVQDRRRVSVKLAHPLYGEIIRTQISRLRARKIRRSLADAIEQFGARRSTDVLAVASWRLDGGDVDAEAFAAAAFEAIRRHDLDLAERLADAAHEHQPSELTARALAMTRHLLGRHHEALQVLEEPLSTAPVGSQSRARLLYVQGLVRGRGVGDYVGAVAALDEVLTGDASEQTRRRAESMLALIQLLEGDAEACRRRSVSLVESGARNAEAFTALVGSLALSGSATEALEHARTFVAEHGEPDPDSLFPDFYWVALLEGGDLDLLIHEVSNAWEVAVDSFDRHRQARAALTYGHALLDRGQAASARSWFDTSARLSRQTGEHYCERWSLSSRMLASVQLGDIADAERCEAALAQLPEHPALVFERAYGERARAWLLAVNGDPVRGRRRLIDLADDLHRRGCVSHAVRALVDVARLGDAALAATAMARFGPTPFEGAALPTFRQFIEASAAAEGTELAAVSDRWFALGYVGLATEAANAAADAFSRVGRARDASTWSRRASELGSATEGGVTPLFVVVDTVVPLTRREREVAGLAAAGRTSREIADACFLSVRTVDNHLARVYDKLGVRSRAELTAAMQPLMVARDAGAAL
jgi:DNA-binding CsgD family transcriptional regulator